MPHYKLPHVEDNMKCVVCSESVNYAIIQMTDCYLSWQQVAN